MFSVLWAHVICHNCFSAVADLDLNCLNFDIGCRIKQNRTQATHRWRKSMHIHVHKHIACENWHIQTHNIYWWKDTIKAWMDNTSRASDISCKNSKSHFGPEKNKIASHQSAWEQDILWMGTNSVTSCYFPYKIKSCENRGNYFRKECF